MTLTVHRLQEHHYGEGSYVLEIKGATEGDAGSYTCIARNYYGRISASATVRVLDLETEEHPRFLKRLNRTDILVGTNGSLDVRVSGTPKPNVKWFKDSMKLKESKRIQVFNCCVNNRVG